jgi:hypothetical protein
MLRILLGAPADLPPREFYRDRAQRHHMSECAGDQIAERYFLSDLMHRRKIMLGREVSPKIGSEPVRSVDTQFVEPRLGFL